MKKAIIYETEHDADFRLNITRSGEGLPNTYSIEARIKPAETDRQIFLNAFYNYDRIQISGSLDIGLLIVPFDGHFIIKSISAHDGAFEAISSGHILLDTDHLDDQDKAVFKKVVLFS